MMLWDQLYTKNRRKYTCYTHGLKVNINFQRKKKNFKKNNQSQRHYTCKVVNYNTLSSYKGRLFRFFLR